MSAILYLRFSPRPIDPTKEDPNEKQLRLILADCAKREIPIRGEPFRDAHQSGGNRRRPQLAEALKALKRGDELVVFKWDRLARDLFKTLSIAEDVKAKRCRLYSVTEGYFEQDGDMMRWAMNAMCALFAQMQRKEYAKRSSDVSRRRQANGEKVSGIVPYGYRIDPENPKRLIGDDEEQRIIVGILLDHHEFGLGVRVIARKLNAARIPCRDNGWNHSLIRSILRREAHPIPGGNGTSA